MLTSQDQATIPKGQVTTDNSCANHEKVEAHNVIQVGYNAEPWSSNNAFLKENNAPVFEERYISNLKVTGDLPKWLNGVYMRNGPNPHFHSENLTFPYDGDGMIHAIYFESSGVKYRNRWIKTEELKAEKRANKSLWNSLTKPAFPSKKDRKAFNAPFTPVKNTANTNIIHHAGHLLAVYEGGVPYKIAEDLETIGTFTFDDNIKGMMPHPKLDPLTGELHFLQYSVVQFPYLRYYVINKRGHVSKDVPIHIKSPTIVHDMILTPNYVVFFLSPLEMSLSKIFSSKNPLKWNPDKPTKIGIIPRHGSSQKVTWFETDPFFVWHTMNGFEENGNLVLDYVHHNHGLPSEQNTPELYRMVINPQKGILSYNAIDDQFIEFPIIDHRKIGQKYRYGYATRRDMALDKEIGKAYFTELIQYDFERKTHCLHKFPKGQFVGEPTFIPHPYKGSETDGVIVAFVYDQNINKSKLIVIEPLNFDKAPLAVVKLPFRVPNGFHGAWIGF
jgi:carotenoid cleavage dioxygenase-like enzyme